MVMTGVMKEVLVWLVRNNTVHLIEYQADYTHWNPRHIRKATKNERTMKYW